MKDSMRFGGRGDQHVEDELLKAQKAAENASWRRRRMDQMRDEMRVGMDRRLRRQRRR